MSIFSDSKNADRLELREDKAKLCLTHTDIKDAVLEDKIYTLEVESDIGSLIYSLNS